MHGCGLSLSLLDLTVCCLKSPVLKFMRSPAPQSTADQSGQDQSAGAGADTLYMPERLTLFDLLIQGKKKLRRWEVFKHEYKS